MSTKYVLSLTVEKLGPHGRKIISSEDLVSLDDAADATTASNVLRKVSAELVHDEKTLKYLANSTACPWCGAQDIQGDGGVDMEGDEVYNPMSCSVCDAQWNDVHILSGIQPK